MRLVIVNRSVTALLLLAFASAVGNGVVSVVLQPYLKHLGLSPQGVGLLQFAMSAATALTLIPSAYLADRHGRRNVALAALAFFLPGFLLVVFPRELALLALGFALLGVGNALTSVSLNPLLADVTPSDKLDYVASTSQILGLAGSLVGMSLTWAPRLAPGASRDLLASYRLLLLLGGTTATLGFPALLLVEDRRPRGQFKLGFSRVTLLLSALSAFTAFGAGASVWMINYYFSAKFGVEAGELGARMAAETLLMILATSAAPLASSRLGTLRAVVVLQLASVPLLVLTAAAGDFLSAATLFTLRTALMNASNPLMWSLSMRLVGEEERSRYAMLNTLAWQFAGGVGSAVGGWLMSLHVDSPLYFTAAVYVLQTLLLYLLLGGRT